MTYISSQHGVPVSARRFSPRPVPEVFTAQQREFLAAISGTRSHAYLRATAGAGKTTTLIEAAWHLPDREGAHFFVYNRDLVGGTTDRLPSGIRASTFHSHGRRMLIRARGGQGLQIDREKTGRLVGVLVARSGSGLTGLEVRALCRVWDQAREALLSADSADNDLVVLAASADCAWLQGAEHVRGFLGPMHASSIADFSGGGDPDFTDLLWLPVQLGLERGSIRVGLVDEGQDLTPLRQGFALHLIGQGDEGEGRLILAADPDQCIYRYSGSRPEALTQLVSDIGAVTFPLSVSFRCPRSHVRLARRVSSFIESSPAAALGRVEHMLASTVQYLPGEAVLCRTNAPLIRLALDLLSQGVRVNLRDNTVAAWLESAARAVFAAPVPLEQLDERMAAYEEFRTEPYEDAVQDGDRQAKLAVRRISDLCDCLRALAERAGRRAGRVMAQAVTSELRRLFGPTGDVLLTTVHGAKGQEWQRVTILYPERLRLENGDPHEEDAVTFVALTRSRDRLRFAYGESAFEGQAWAFWEPGPGVYAQVESRMVSSEGPVGHDVRVSSLKVVDLAGFDARRSQALAERPAPEPITRERSAPTPQVDWLAVVKRSFQGEEAAGQDGTQAAAVVRTWASRESSRSRRAAGPTPTMEELRLWAAQSRRAAERQLREGSVHPLFKGSFMVPASDLAEVLRVVASCSRKALSAFALAAQAELARKEDADVEVDRRLATGMLDVWQYLREVEPDRPDGLNLEDRAVGGSCSAVVWTGERFDRKPINYTRSFGGAIMTDVESRRLKFDAVSGELAGVAFNPFNPYLILG